MVGLRPDMMEQFQQLSLSFVSQQEGYDDGEDIDENQAYVFMLSFPISILYQTYVILTYILWFCNFRQG